MGTIFNYFEKVQDLQKKTFSSKVNIDIAVKFDTKADRPWFTVIITTAGWPEFNSEKYKYFAFYEWHTPEEWEKTYNEFKDTVKEWINL